MLICSVWLFAAFLCIATVVGDQHKVTSSTTFTTVSAGQIKKRVSGTVTFIRGGTVKFFGFERPLISREVPFKLELIGDEQPWKQTERDAIELCRAQLTPWRIDFLAVISGWLFVFAGLLVVCWLLGRHKPSTARHSRAT